MTNKTRRTKSEAYNNYVVSKSNKLINAQYDLSLNELKIMLILASRIQPKENVFNQYTFKVSELAEILRISREAMYKELPKITDNLMDKRIEILSDDGKYLLQARPLSAAFYMKGEGKVVLEFSNFLAPYLLELKNCFTSYRLENALVLKSKYSLRLYELFKSHAFEEQPFLLKVEELKTLLKLTQKYKAYGHLKAKVIDVAVKEISEMTDLTVEYNDERVGRKVENLYFTITEKSPNEIKNKRFRLETNSSSDVSTESTKTKTKPSPTKKGAKKEEPFVDYLQTVVKQKTKKHLPKKDARLIAELVNEDMSKFGPVLPHLNENIANPTGFIRDFFTNPKKYKPSQKPIREERMPEDFNQPKAELSEEEKQARVRKMEELRDKYILNGNSSQLSIPL